jgi:prolyl-tRNA synthetase
MADKVEGAAEQPAAAAAEAVKGQGQGQGKGKGQGQGKGKGQAKKPAVQKEEEKVTFNVKKEDFSEWFDQIMQFAGIMDKRYPVKGMPVFCPYGFAIHNKMMSILEAEWEKLGIEKAQFPLLIPKEFFELEGEFAKGFEEEVFWVTMGGLKPLDVHLAMRPTSETPMYYMFAQWIRTYRDLPLKVHQTCSVFRHETKQTRPLIRAREIHWNEAHTCHTTKELALEDLENAWKAYLYLIQDCALFTGLRLRRPNWDKFPGAEHTDVMDTIMPSGRVLQTVGAHYLGQKFARSFDIKFLNDKNKHEFVHMACYGVSTRLSAASLSIHGDDRGLVIPPILARWQVLIVPIVAKKSDDRTVKKAHEVAAILKDIGLRVFVDDSNQSPGEKYYHWEMKGVPLRIEIGPRDLDAGVITAVPRDTREKKTLPAAANEVAGNVRGELDAIHARLRKAAFDFHESHLRTCLSKEDMIAALDAGCVARIPFHSMDHDGEEADKVVHELAGGEVRGWRPDEAPPEEGVMCIITGKPAKHWGYAARCY